MPERIVPTLAEVVELLALKELRMVVERSRFLSLPDALRNQSNNVGREVIESLRGGFRFNGSDGLVYSSERDFFEGIAELKQDSRYSKRKFLSLIVRPEVYFASMHDLGFTTIHVNAGLAGHWEADEESIKEVVRIIGFRALVHQKHLFVVEGPDKFALSTEIDDRQYALSFFTEADGTSTVEGLRDEQGDVRLSKNSIGQVCQGILDSGFDGLVINPAFPSQVLLSKDDLSAVLAVMAEEKKRRGLLGGLLEAWRI